MLLEGQAVFTIGGESKTVKPGDMWRIPGNVLHKVTNGSKPGKAIAAMITIVVLASVVFFVITTIQAAHGIR